MKTVDMSPEAIAGRLDLLNQLWELCMALSKAKIVHNPDPTATEPTRDIIDQTITSNSPETPAEARPL